MNHQPMFERSAQLTDAHTLHDTMTVVSQQMALQADGYRCHTTDLWQILLAAAARHSTIEAVCADLLTAPHANTIRGYLHDQLGLAQIADLEQGWNRALQQVVPDWLRDRPQAIALDLHDEPYYGQSDPDDPDNWVCRGEARAGTTHFYRCATAYVLLHDAHFTLAVVFVKPTDPLVTIVERLIQRVTATGIRISCIYADKGFCSIPILRFLHDHGYSAIIPIPIRGRQGGTRALCQGPISHWATHTFASTANGQLTVPVAVTRAFKRHAGRRSGTWCLYACVHVQAPVRCIRPRYRHRFGIESSYRVMEQARARTTARNPALRFLLMGLALFIMNMWLRIHWLYLRLPGAGPRRIDRTRFRFDRMRHFLTRAVERLYGVCSTISLPAP